jgi:hypothetical protein
MAIRSAPGKTGQDFNVVHTVHHVLHYPFIHPLLYTALCSATHILVLVPTCFGVY